MRWIARFFTVLGVLAFIAMLAAGGSAWWLWQRWSEEPALPGSMVLELDLRRPLMETPDDDPLALLDQDSMLTVDRVVAALDRAAKDPAVKGLVARLGEGGGGLGVAAELRSAIARFRAAGKPTLAWADTLGELGPANEGYYIASAFDEIRLQPGGMVGLTGLSIEVPFARKLLDRVGIAIELEKREAYKTAFDSLTEEGLTDANRAMLESLLAALEDEIVAGIAEGRGLDEAEVRRLMDGGPWSAGESVDNGLIDALGYADELGDWPEGEDMAARLALADYALATAEEPAEGAVKVALVRATGNVVRGDGGLFGEIAGDSLAAAIDAAAADEDIGALLLRLDTGGGSAVASETAARAIRQMIEGGRPVVVSMGNTAASGGYWIAMGASRIVAQPTTLTGSIGVIAGKPVLEGMWDKLGVDWERVRSRDHAGFWSMHEAYDAGMRQRLASLVDAIYDDFIEGVAAGREMEPAKVREIAGGRVWTGRQGLELGLVDRLGGYAEAIEELESLTGAGDGIALVPYPPEPGPLERLMRLLELRPDMLLAAWRDLVGLGPAAPVAMPAISIR